MTTCNQCGACCRVLTVEQSPEEIQAIAAITGLLGIPSDMIFAAKHWHPLPRTEALRRNPFYASRLPADTYFYCCDQLGDDGRCQSHPERPLVCRGYPWYDQPVRDMALPAAVCEFHYDQVIEFVIRRPDL
ncbi:MAG: YkgJ family cysteine cluster protein [Deltaproteobacteria bacterium]|nr:YkgJ family cysteine cluster protein [Deltaproteobacteria bacterium]